ncbi:hypothetical protein ACFQH6_03015 [Halobacteriaceae archaeon GCM10025711]
MVDSDATLFSETQRARQPWLWAILAWALVAALRRRNREKHGWRRVPLVFGAVLFLWSVRLTTAVDEDGVAVRLSPLHPTARRIPLDAIDGYEAVRYRPLLEFGGWGIRWRPGTLAYTTSGRDAVVLKRSGRRDLLVGTQRPDEFVAALDRALP